MSWEKCEDICKYAPWGWKWPCYDCRGYSKAEPKERKLVKWDEYKREHEDTWENWETRDIACPVWLCRLLTGRVRLQVAVCHDSVKKGAEQLLSCLDVGIGQAKVRG